MIKRSIEEEDITILNTYAPNIGTPQYIRQMLKTIKEEIDSNALRVGDFNTLLIWMDRSFTQKINKETQTLKHKIDQMNLIDIFRILHQK